MAKKKEEVKEETVEVEEAPLLVVDLSEEKVKVTVPDVEKVSVVASGVVISKEVALELMKLCETACAKSNVVPFRKDLKRLIAALGEGLAK